MKNTQRICSCCGQGYTDGEGHNYDKCVQRCRERLSSLLDQVDDARTTLHKAQEIQAQDWWKVKAKED